LDQNIEASWKKIQAAALGGGKAADREKVEESLDWPFNIVQCFPQIFLCGESGSNCPNPSQCCRRVHIICTCTKEKKVPVEELE
jgi:hypothetical protein